MISVRHIYGPKKGAAFTTDIALEAVSGGGIKTTPTIASGDFKVSKDEGALANPNTLPSESPASSGIVKIVLDATEMNADRVVVRFIDQAGSEWLDGLLIIHTRAVTVDELVRSTTPANTLDVSSTGEAGLDFNNVKDAVSSYSLVNFSIQDIGRVGEATTLADDAIGASTLQVGAITANAIATDAIQKIWDRATSALTTAGSIGKWILDNITALANKIGNVGTTSGNNTIDGKLTALANKSAAKPTDFGAFDGNRDALQAIGGQADLVDDIYGQTFSMAGSLAPLLYTVRIPAYRVLINSGSAKDEWALQWMENGVAAEVDASWITVYKDDGTQLIPRTAMTAIGSTGAYKYNATGTKRMSGGAPYLVVFEWAFSTISGESRVFVGRDS